MLESQTNFMRIVGWIGDVLRNRLEFYKGIRPSLDTPAPRLSDDGSELAEFIRTNEPTYEELVVIMMALIPQVHAHYFSNIITSVNPEGGDLPELGGVRGTNHRGFLPTGETIQFILAGEDISGRLAIQNMFSSEHWFAKKRVVWLEKVREGEPVMSGRLILDDEFIEKITVGIVSKPRFSIDFPAEHIDTAMDWSDLVLHPTTLAPIREIENWIKHNDTVMNVWGMKKRVKPGYRALFYGPPGTGKTLTATLLGKHTKKDVFRIDLSRVISKYIGETEKNLSRLFDKAEHKDWVLFFDEADALFGKRTDIRDSHDKYANQEVAYLLQRIESYNGLVILATNQRSNIDEAFIRRFQSIVHFPMPRPEERYAIWIKTIPEHLQVSSDIDWHQVAMRYEITGAGILNVAHYCALEAVADESNALDLVKLEGAIRREFVKEGKVM